MNQIMNDGANTRSICADADWPTAPPRHFQKGNSIWTTRILVLIFSVFLELKSYLMVCMYQSEKETGSL